MMPAAQGGDDDLPRLEAQKATLVIGVGRSVFVSRLHPLAPQPALVFVSLTHPVTGTSAATTARRGKFAIGPRLRCDSSTSPASSPAYGRSGGSGLWGFCTDQASCDIRLRKRRELMRPLECPVCMIRTAAKMAATTACVSSVIKSPPGLVGSLVPSPRTTTITGTKRRHHGGRGSGSGAGSR